MGSLLSQPVLQEQTLRFYGELTALEVDWVGKLVIGAGGGCASSGLAAACSLAGAACLLVEPNVAEAKAVLRDGGIDFLVSTVDEALRTLKNEIRKGRALAVVVTGDASAAVRELMRRGVQPHLFFLADGSDFASGNRGWEGVKRLDLSVDGLLQRFLEARGLEARTWPLPGRAAVRVFDRELLEVIGDDLFRRRWVEGIARYQRSAAQDYRCCWVTEAELDQIADTLTGIAL